LKFIKRCSFIICVLVASFCNPVMAIEEPDYQEVLKQGNFEIREYAAKIIAHVSVSGDFDDASSKGFKLLADYIFGNNFTEEGSSNKISMTAPVEMAPLSQQVQITAPILQHGYTQEWQVNFVMPKEYDLISLPKPNNPSVQLIEVPPKKYAVIVFSGLVRESSYEEKANLLNQFLIDQSLQALGPVKIARYNPPWTLPFFRRNELMVEIN